ncbi:MAG: VTT domain-containing protein [Verrucomicrobiota bacterium]
MDLFDQLLEFLKNYGAPIVLLWSIFETDLIFLVLGALLHSGSINPYTCFAAAIFGSLLHDTAVFWLAKNRAPWVRERKVYIKFAQAIEKFANKLGPMQLAVCRPLYGTRYPTIIFWGLQHLSYPRFWAALCTGLFPWATLLSAIGYALWTHISEFDDRLKEAKNWILGGVVIVVVLYLVSKLLKKKAASATVLAPESPAPRSSAPEPPHGAKSHGT